MACLEWGLVCESAQGIVVNQMSRRLLGLTVQVDAYCMFAVTWFDLFFVPFMSQIGTI